MTEDLVYWPYARLGTKDCDDDDDVVSVRRLFKQNKHENNGLKETLAVLQKCMPQLYT